MSSPHNPYLDPPQPETGASASILPPLIPPKTPAENPAWTGWEVLALAIVSVVLTLAVVLSVFKLLHPTLPVEDLIKFPILVVLSQGAAYVAILGLMYMLATHSHSESFAQAIRWNFPHNWPFYLLAGVVLSVALQLFAHLLPIPKKLPMDQFFQTSEEAYVLAIFGITFAPLLEELFFRGFLYPVLARRLGTAVGVFLTALAFALIHGEQLRYSWAAVLVIFIVGLTLTLVRAATKSVAAGLLMHIAYNGTISVIMFAATSGFRHLERLNQ